MTDALRAELSKILDVELGLILPERSLAECQWDSISAVQFITIANMLYDVVIDADQLGGCRTIGDLLSLLPETA